MYYLKIFAKAFLSLFAIMRLTGVSTKNPASVILFMVFLYILPFCFLLSSYFSLSYKFWFPFILAS